MALTALEQATRLEPSNTDFARAVKSVKEALDKAAKRSQAAGNGKPERLASETSTASEQEVEHQQGKKTSDRSSVVVGGSGNEGKTKVCKPRHGRRL